MKKILLLSLIVITTIKAHGTGGVVDGQSVSAGVTNPAFIFKNADDIDTHKLGLNDGVDGTSITSTQKALNTFFNVSGSTETVPGYNYNATLGTVYNGNTYQTAIASLANKFDPSTGHMHTGAPGDGPVLSGSSVLPATHSQPGVVTLSDQFLGAGTKTMDQVNTGELSLIASMSGIVSLKAASTTTPYVLFLPPAQGSSGQVMRNDGLGNLSWATSSAGIAIGSSITSGTPHSVLFVDGSGNLGQNVASLSFDNLNFTMFGRMYASLNQPSDFVEEPFPGVLSPGIFFSTDNATGSGDYMVATTDSSSPTSQEVDLLVGTGSFLTGANATTLTGDDYFFTGNNLVTGTNGGTGSQISSTGNSAGSGGTGSYISNTGNNTGSGDTGGYFFTTGNATSGNSGDMTLLIGSAGGSKGSIIFQDGTQGHIGWSWKSKNISGGGNWADSFVYVDGSNNNWLARDPGASVTSASNNLAIGSNALNSLSSGGSDTCIGTAACSSVSSGVANTMIGTTTGTLTTGSYNTYVGNSAGVNNTGSNNTVIGDESLSGGSADFNTVVGIRALNSLSTGTQNVAIGPSAGNALTTGSEDTFLGSTADAGANNLTFATAIGYGAIVGASNAMVLGKSGANIAISDVESGAPTARLSLPAGTTTAYTAPLKIASGVNLTTPEAGAIENDGVHLYYTDNTPVRNTLMIKPDQGSVCGWYDSVGVSLVVSCKGSNPNVSCPTGYTQETTTGAKFCAAN